MTCRGKRAGNLVITASAAGGRCAADLACSQLVEQENEDALSGTPRLLCFVFQLERHISPGSKTFSMNSFCKCLIDFSYIFLLLRENPHHKTQYGQLKFSLYGGPRS